ncbi:hypothetical protein DTL42_00410 [Bremerella cremea]|uniref:Uncharacterized protein n=2 Tax=Bremerella cremea TaxID=1031537 RepID=A0A368KXU1_9BACT|nr:hypothetical protein DTL42_00410 [Bremerella cremea]
MGAVNRCWKCGTQFQRIEGAQIPPIRRSPVLATYVVAAAPPQDSTTDAVYEAIVAEEAEDGEPTEPNPEARLAPFLKGQEFLSLKRLDYPSLSASALALLTILLGFYSILAIPFGLVAAIAGVHLLNHRRSATRWTVFFLGIVALIVALLGIISAIYYWWMRSSLFLLLWGQTN